MDRRASLGLRAVGFVLMAVAIFLVFSPTRIEFRGSTEDCGPTLFAVFPNDPAPDSTERELALGDACVAAMMRRMGIAVLVGAVTTSCLVLSSSSRIREQPPPRPDQVAAA